MGRNSARGNREATKTMTNDEAQMPKKMTNDEIRMTKEWLMTKYEKIAGHRVFFGLWILDFGFLSSFVLRHSSLHRNSGTITATMLLADETAFLDTLFSGWYHQNRC